MDGWGRVAPTVAACGGATLFAVQLICNHLGVKFFGAFIARLCRTDTAPCLSSAQLSSVRFSLAQLSDVAVVFYNLHKS